MQDEVEHIEGLVQEQSICNSCPTYIHTELYFAHLTAMFLHRGVHRIVWGEVWTLEKLGLRGITHSKAYQF